MSPDDASVSIKCHDLCHARIIWSKIYINRLNAVIFIHVEHLAYEDIYVKNWIILLFKNSYLYQNWSYSLVAFSHGIYMKLKLIYTNTPLQSRLFDAANKIKMHVVRSNHFYRISSELLPRGLFSQESLCSLYNEWSAIYKLCKVIVNTTVIIPFFIYWSLKWLLYSKTKLT